jgi:nuclear transport factor 2 (NTF2) superfamily protein
MARQDTEAMLWFGGRWWWFPGARIDTDSEFEWHEGKMYLLESNGNIVEGVEVNDVMPPRFSSMNDHPCCYYQCHRTGTIHIGENGNPDTQWICGFHRDRWNADRARFIADVCGCEMEEL